MPQLNNLFNNLSLNDQVLNDHFDLAYLKQQAIQPSHIKDTLDESTRDQFYWSSAWRSLRPFIIRRDHYECQVCKHQGKVTIKTDATKLIVHHIRPLEFYPESSLDADNLVTVCQPCHNQIHFSDTFSRGNLWEDEWWGD